MDRVVACVEQWVGQPVERARTVNCHHNYTAARAALRQGRVAVAQGRHRRRSGGARADPGLAWARASYVVVGKGNAAGAELRTARRGPQYSPCRGAQDVHPGRPATRRWRGIEYRDTDAFLDEIPDAYKDIDVVMRDAADLVEVRHTLRQIVNVKGD